ncbi:RNA recognition motif domain-containing protein [Chitinophagaceae bacterium MMS25-I14]
MNIFVGNLNASVNTQNLKNLFSEFGLVRSVIIIRNTLIRNTGNSCWLVMNEPADAGRAIEALDRIGFMQSIINVRKATLHI